MLRSKRWKGNADMSLVQLGLYLSACMAAAATGILFQPGPWYDALRKPSWTPPRWAFPVAWTILYVMIAVAAARVAGLPASGTALALWSVQIALNTLWTPVFFGARRLRTGMIVIAALWLTVLALIVTAFGLDWVAGLVLVPYLIWLSFAAALNFWLWRNNPAPQGRTGPEDVA